MASANWMKMNNQKAGAIMSQLHNQTTGQSFLEVFQNAWARKLKKEKSHDYGMER